jgi:hypothetical protein
VDSALEQSARRPRRRPPLKSYVPFFVFATGCIVLLISIVWLAAHLVLAATHGSSASPVHKANLALVQPTHSTHRAPVHPSSPTPTVAEIGSMMAMGSLPPTPTVAGIPTSILHRTMRTATPTSAVSLVIARSVKGETPLQVSTLFISPAMRLWVVAKVKNVHATDVLRFVFKFNGATLPHDDITVVAGTSMGGHSFLPVQSFKAWADYDRGAKPLPSGQYRVLFYKNNRLEGQTAFHVG